MAGTPFVRGRVAGHEFREIRCRADHIGLIGRQNNFDFNSE